MSKILHVCAAIAILTAFLGLFSASAGAEICHISVVALQGSQIDNGLWIDNDFSIDRITRGSNLDDHARAKYLADIPFDTGLVFAKPNGEFELYWRDRKGGSQFDRPAFEKFSRLQIPTCAMVQSLIQQFDIRLEQTRKAVEYLRSHSVDFLWGPFFLSLESNLYYQGGRWMDSADTLRRYQDQLETIKTASSKWPTGNPDEYMDSMSGEIFKTFGMQNYCLRANTMSGVFSDSCMACQGQTLAVISVIHDLQIKLPNGYKLGVQFFTDHVRPVIWDQSQRRLRDLVYYGDWESKVEEPVYDSEILFDAFLHGGNSALMASEKSDLRTRPKNCYDLTQVNGWMDQLKCSRFGAYFKGNVVYFTSGEVSNTRSGLFANLNVGATHRFIQSAPPEVATLERHQPRSLIGPPAFQQKPFTPRNFPEQTTKVKELREIYEARSRLRPDEAALIAAIPRVANFEGERIFFEDKDENLKYQKLKYALDINRFLEGRRGYFRDYAFGGSFVTPAIDKPPFPLPADIDRNWSTLSMLERTQATDAALEAEWNKHMASPEALAIMNFLANPVSDSQSLLIKPNQFIPWLAETKLLLVDIYKSEDRIGWKKTFPGTLIEVEDLNIFLDGSLRDFERMVARYSYELARRHRQALQQFSAAKDDQITSFYEFNRALSEIFEFTFNESTSVDLTFPNISKKYFPDWKDRDYELTKRLHYPLQAFFQKMITDPDFQYTPALLESDRERMKDLIADHPIQARWGAKVKIQPPVLAAKGSCDGKKAGFYPDEKTGLSIECGNQDSNSDDASRSVAVRVLFVVPSQFIYRLLDSLPAEYLMEPHVRLLTAMIWSDGFVSAVGADKLASISEKVFAPSPFLQGTPGYVAEYDLNALPNSTLLIQNSKLIKLINPILRAGAPDFERLASDPLYRLALPLWRRLAEKAGADPCQLAELRLGWYEFRCVGHTFRDEIVRIGSKIIVYSPEPKMDPDSYDGFWLGRKWIYPIFDTLLLKSEFGEI